MTTLERPFVAAALDEAEWRTLAAIAEDLIPAAHGMPSAADVLTEDRLRFVLNARQDLLEPLRAALRPGLGAGVGARLDLLGRNEPGVLAALQLVIVGAYYTDKRVRELIGYPGQMAIDVRSWEYPAYLEEGLVDAMLARGPTWRDPATGRRAVAERAAPRSYAERWSGASDAPMPGTAEGGDDGRDEAS
jgi:hypothetical protein